MTNNDFLKILKTAYPEVPFELSGQDCKLAVQAIGAIFEKKSLVERQRLLNQPLKPFIATGELHAVRYQIYTPSEWSKYLEGNISG